MILPHITACPNCAAPRTKPLKCPECGWLFRIKPRPEWAKAEKPRRIWHPEEVYQRHGPRPPFASGGTEFLIRGFRVRAADIEERLIEHPSVSKTCAVMRLVGKGRKYPAIIAFIELSEGVTIWRGMNRDLREWCRVTLPAWKLPDRVVPVAQIGDRKSMAAQPLARLRIWVPIPAIRNALNEFHFEGVVRDLVYRGGFVRLVVAQREEARERGISLAVRAPLSLVGNVKQGSLVALSGKFGFKSSLHADRLELRERQTLIRLSNTKAVLEAL